MAGAETLDTKGTPTPDRPAVSLAAIRQELAEGNIASLVGELAVLHPTGYNGIFYPRTDFYVEPLVPPQIPGLTDDQVNALNAAAYYKRQPTAELSAIPRHFADEYNRVLRDMLPPTRFPGSTVRFGFVSNLADARVNFGYRMYRVQDETAQITQRTAVVVTNPKLQSQLVRVQRVDHTETREHLTEVRVRLFPPGLARRVYDYEKGYFVDGNVREWKGPVYKGIYIPEDQITPSQLQALARGEQPWPEVEYLTESEFNGDPEKVMKLLISRTVGRESTIDLMFGGVMLEVDDPSPELQAILKEHEEENERLGVHRTYGYGDFDESNPLMAEYYTRVGDPTDQHTH